jgi:hypothetical protein
MTAAMIWALSSTPATLAVLGCAAASLGWLAWRVRARWGR